MEHLEEGRRTQKRQVISAEDLPEVCCPSLCSTTLQASSTACWHFDSLESRFHATGTLTVPNQGSMLQRTSRLVLPELGLSQGVSNAVPWP